MSIKKLELSNGLVQAILAEEASGFSLGELSKKVNQKQKLNLEIKTRFSVLAKALRLHFEQNQIQFAKLLGVSQGWISKIESKKHIPSLEEWLTFCLVLGVPPELMFISDNLYQKVVKEIQKAN